MKPKKPRVLWVWFNYEKNDFARTGSGFILAGGGLTRSEAVASCEEGEGAVKFIEVLPKRKPEVWSHITTPSAPKRKAKAKRK